MRPVCAMRCTANVIVQSRWHWVDLGTYVCCPSASCFHWTPAPMTSQMIKQHMDIPGIEYSRWGLRGRIATIIDNRWGAFQD